MCKWMCGFRSSSKSSYGVEEGSDSRKSSTADIPGMDQEVKVDSSKESYKVTSNS